MKNLHLKTVIFAAIAIAFAACSEDFYEINLPPQVSNDTTIINYNYYYLDTSGGVVNNNNILQYNVDLQGDCNIVGFFINNDSDSVFTDHIDDELGQINTCAYFEPPIISFNNYVDENGCTVFEMFVDDSLYNSTVICPIILPGDTIIRDSIIHDTIVRDSIVRDTVLIEGQDWVREYYYEGFDNPGNSVYYESISWGLGLGFSANQIGSSSGNGTLVTWDEYDYDTAWSPDLFSEPMALKYLSIYVGSLTSYSVSILLKDVSGNIFVLDTLNAFHSGFDWQNISTYNIVTYETTVDNLEYMDIVQVGLAKEGVFFPSSSKSGAEGILCNPTRDQKLNSDEWSVTGIAPLE